MERGFLASAAEGYQSPSVAVDLERCLQLAGTDLRDDQLFATFLAVCSYYIRVPTSLEPLSCWRWYRPAPSKVDNGFVQRSRAR